MITIYDVLEVDKNASKEEIEKAYQNLILKYHKDPKLGKEANEDNELILNKIKIAYEILSDDEKRKKYDKDLANMKAEELIKNVSINTNDNNSKTEETSENEELEEKAENTTENIKASKKIKNDSSKKQYKVVNSKSEQEESESLTKEEKQKIVKAAQSDFNKNLKKAQKAEEEYNKAYNEAYNNYLRKMGYKVKEPWTLKRIRNLVLSILVIILICAIIWILPVTRNFLTNIYENNFVVKAFVDIVVMIYEAIISVFN